MYLVLEIELKLNYDNGIEYMCHHVRDKSATYEGAIEQMNQRANGTLENGYFDKVISKSASSITLHNGGTAYKRYCVVDG